MTTIEERGKEFRNSKETEYGVTDLIGLEIGYVEGATEQDRIARAEECERCVQAAQEWLMEYLGDTDRDNPIVESLTKAIEEGGEV